MFEYFTRHLIETIVLCFVVIGLAAYIWDVIPGIIKLLAVVLIVVGFVSIVREK